MSLFRRHLRAVLLAATLALAGQGTFLALAAEHHHTGPDSDHNCALCLAISTFSASAPPPAPIAPLALLTLIDLPGESRPPILCVRPTASPRGPPAA